MQQKPLYIISSIDKETNLSKTIGDAANLLNSNSSINIQLVFPEALKKSVNAQLSKNKHIGKYVKAGTFNTLSIEDKANPFSKIKVTSEADYWMVKPQYFSQLQNLYNEVEKSELKNASVYVLASSKQKTSFLNRAIFRLFHTVEARGVENGFVGFSGKHAKGFLSLAGINTQNYSYKIASYAALKGLKIQEIEANISIHKSKIGIGKAITNAIGNVWQWMVKEPLQAIKEKNSGSIWQAQHPVWRLVFFCLAVLGIVSFPILSFSYGITWDEHGDAEYAKRVLSYYMSFGDDKSVFKEAETNTIFGHLLYYGPMVNLFMAFVAKYLSPFGLYETRHIIVSLIGITGIIYAGRTGKLLGNWQTGVIVMLLLLISPHFFGHQFNNQKDTPFAAGYIISIYYLICFIKELPNPSRKTSFLVALSFGLTIGVRIGGLLLPAYLLMSMGLWWLVQTFKNNIKNTGKQILPLITRFAVISISAYIIGILFWPWALKNPIENPISALTEFTNYLNVFNFELFEGEVLYMANKPWYYLPKYIFIQTPLFIWVGVVLFVLLLLPRIKNKNLWLWLLLVFVAVFPVGYAIIKNSSLYNGWRQFLFIYPPLIILAAMGWQWLIQLPKQNTIKATLFGLLFINIGYIGFWMIKYHPNQYVYFNETVGGTKGAYSYYETDYYSNSLKQAADWFNVNIGTDKPYVISTNNETQTADYFIKKENKNAQVVWSREHEVLTKAADYSFITTRAMSRHQLTCGFFPPKGTLHTIDVEGIPLVAIVKRENNYLPKADVFYEDRVFDSAAYYAKKAVEYDPKNVEALRLLGQSHISLNNIDKAEKYLQQSYKLFPDDYLVVELIGEVFFRRRQYDSALKYFKKSTELRINFSKGYLNWGVTQFNQKKYKAAIINFNKTIEYADEVKPSYYTFIAKCHHALKQYNQGIEAANTALAINPNEAEAYKMLAVIYDEMGDNEQAQAMFRRYVEITGSYE
jgi:tetratricopeptide (TPR) repeat protein